MDCLVVVDMQNDFLPGGALAVPGGDEVIGLINHIQQDFSLVVATQDWHPAEHKSFASSHAGRQVMDVVDYKGIQQILWPDHCVRGTPGAAFSDRLHTSRMEAIFRKGTNPEIDSYSGFFDNGKLKSTGLHGYLKEKGVTSISVCGLAADFCVYFTAMDAISLGYKVTIIDDASRAIDPDTYQKKKQEFLSVGGILSKKNLNS